MKLSEIAEMIESFGLPFTYLQWDEDVPDLPYIAYYYPETRTESADDSNFIQIKQLNIDLYTKNKNIELALDIEELKVHGNVGCNIVNGSLLLDASKANSIMFLDLISTMKSCPDLALETEILIALELTEYYKKGKDEKTLILCDKDNNIVLELTSTTENYTQK